LLDAFIEAAKRIDGPKRQPKHITRLAAPVDPLVKTRSNPTKANSAGKGQASGAYCGDG
jgi:hypothetical protein